MSVCSIRVERLRKRINFIPIFIAIGFVCLNGLPSRAKGDILTSCSDRLADFARRFHDPGGLPYRTNRGLSDYNHYLGPRFLDVLRGFNKEAHWLDVGSGDAVFARQYLRSWFWALRFKRSRARMTAVGVEEPRSHSTQTFLASPPEGFRYLYGQPIERRSLEEIGLSNLITDVYGALSYGHHFDELLRFYGQLLKPAGEIHSVLLLHSPRRFQEHITDRDLNIRIRRTNGEFLPVENYLKLIQGFQINTQTVKLRGEQSHLRLHLRRTNSPIFIPRLEFTQIKHTIPPLREYILIEN